MFGNNRGPIRGPGAAKLAIGVILGQLGNTGGHKGSLRGQRGLKGQEVATGAYRRPKGTMGACLFPLKTKWGHSGA